MPNLSSYPFQVERNDKKIYNVLCTWNNTNDLSIDNYIKAGGTGQFVVYRTQFVLGMSSPTPDCIVDSMAQPQERGIFAAEIEDKIGQANKELTCRESSLDAYLRSHSPSYISEGLEKNIRVLRITVEKYKALKHVISDWTWNTTPYMKGLAEN